jgi:riboflavin kinase/FMN adenylyltransferase
MVARYVHINPPVNINDEPISSTRIRKDITAGQVKVVSCLLGRFYSISGKVTHGLKRGKELGFPTANLMIPSEIVIPLIGVYTGFVTIFQEGKTQSSNRLSCVINIGHCPTFKEETSEIKIEAHILDFPYRELYNANVKLEFVERLRNEEKFNSKEELIVQIKKDCEVGRKIIKTVSI